MRTWLQDFGATFLFLFVLLATGDIYLATGFGIAAAIASLAWTWIRHRRVEAMQGLGLAIVLVMGGATILLHDPRYVMFKPTVVNCCLGAVMLKPGWVSRYLPTVAVDVPQPLIVAIGYVYAATMFILAAANAAVASLASQKTWAIYNAAIPWIVFTLLALVSWRLMRTAAIAVRRSRAQAA
jgi:intracellular septation protein A